MAIILAVVDIYILDFVINIGTSLDLIDGCCREKSADFMVCQHNLRAAH
jgi:hypothetical protein